MFKISYKPYSLELDHVFRISRGARSSTPILLTRIEYEGEAGYGEASMPPLYGESIESAINFIEKVDLSGYNNPLDIESMMAYIDSIEVGNAAAKASIDIALHDLAGRILDEPCYRMLKLPGLDSVATAKTIGMDKLSIIKERTNDAKGFQFLKIKLGSVNDREVMETVRSSSDVPLYVDANQGWREKSMALDNIHWLNEQGVVFVEQPMPVEMKDEMAWLKERSPLPIVGDESIQRLTDMTDAENFYHGVNIKLVKSTGFIEGVKMAKLAKKKGLKIMLGCMSETSCLISAAFQMASLADWIDLDGNLMITNDPYYGIETVKGKLINNDLPGIGLIRPELSWESIPDRF